jgi:hypothetical protein
MAIFDIPCTLFPRINPVLSTAMAIASEGEQR